MRSAGRRILHCTYLTGNRLINIVVDNADDKTLLANSHKKLHQLGTSTNEYPEQSRQWIQYRTNIYAQKATRKSKRKQLNDIL